MSRKRAIVYTLILGLILFGVVALIDRPHGTNYGVSSWISDDRSFGIVIDETNLQFVLVDQSPERNRDCYNLINEGDRIYSGIMRDRRTAMESTLVKIRIANDSLELTLSAGGQSKKWKLKRFDHSRSLII